MKHEVKLQAFAVPATVLSNPGFRPSAEAPVNQMCFRLSDLSNETLESMCEEFRRDVFAKAGRKLAPPPLHDPDVPISSIDGLDDA